MDSVRFPHICDGCHQRAYHTYSMNPVRFLQHALQLGSSRPWKRCSTYSQKLLGREYERRTGCQSYQQSHCTPAGGHPWCLVSSGLSGKSWKSRLCHVFQRRNNRDLPLSPLDTQQNWKFTEQNSSLFSDSLFSRRIFFVRNM